VSATDSVNRSIKRPQIKSKEKDRLFWVIIFLFWKNWNDSLIVLRAESKFDCDMTTNED
jgi:hypothetical protein